MEGVKENLNVRLWSYWVRTTRNGWTGCEGVALVALVVLVSRLVLSLSLCSQSGLDWDGRSFMSQMLIGRESILG